MNKEGKIKDETLLELSPTMYEIQTKTNNSSQGAVLLVCLCFPQFTWSHYNSSDDAGDTGLDRKATGLIWVLQGVVHDGHQSQPGLSGSGDNLIGWQQEAIATSVPQLKGVGVLDALVVGPVHGATTGLVYD